MFINVTFPCVAAHLVKISLCITAIYNIWQINTSFDMIHCISRPTICVYIANAAKSYNLLLLRLLSSLSDIHECLAMYVSDVT